MHTVFALLCFVVVIHWLIFPYPSGLLHWHCGNLTIAPVPAKQPWWIWINTSCEFIMNDCITTTKQSTTKPCAYFLGYTTCTSLIDTLLQHHIIRDPINFAKIYITNVAMKCLVEEIDNEDWSWSFWVHLLTLCHSGSAMYLSMILLVIGLGISSVEELSAMPDHYLPNPGQNGHCRYIVELHSWWIISIEFRNKMPTFSFREMH